MAKSSFFWIDGPVDFCYNNDDEIYRPYLKMDPRSQKARGDLDTEEQHPPFPACFPSDFESDILPSAIQPIRIPVYRICTGGVLCKDAFLSSYEEVVRGLRPRPHWMDDAALRQPGTYSTSCFYEKSDALHILKCLRRHYPRPIIAYGEARFEEGPVQRTIEREPNAGSHVDWWLYQDMDPSPRFEVCGREEQTACQV